MTATREHYRKRRISELAQRFVPTELPGNKHYVIDNEQRRAQVAGPYETAEMARTQCRMMLADEVELLYLPDEATATARIQTIIGEQSDRAWAAKMIFEMFQGAKK
jgi:hypothetical protein